MGLTVLVQRFCLRYLSEKVFIDGTLTLTLQLDGSTVRATFTSDGSIALAEANFSYTITDGDSASAINYAATDSLAFSAREHSQMQQG